MAVTFDTDLKRKGASPPVSARNMRFLTGQLALFRYKVVANPLTKFETLRHASLSVGPRSSYLAKISVSLC